MNKHVALQVQYTQQQRQLQELIAEKSALRMQSMVGGIGVDIAKRDVTLPGGLLLIAAGPARLLLPMP